MSMGQSGIIFLQDIFGYLLRAVERPELLPWFQCQRSSSGNVEVMALS